MKSVSERNRAPRVLLLMCLALSTAASAGAGESPDPRGASGGTGAAATTATTLAMTAAPIFGNDAALGYGWQEIVVTLANSGSAPRKGMIELRAQVPWGTDSFVTRAPFNVPAGRTAIVRVPTHGFYMQAPTITLSAKDEKGAEITGTGITANMSVAPTLVEVSQTPRIGMFLRGRAIVTSYALSSAGGYYGAYGGYGGYGTPSSSSLAVGAPSFDPTTGDPVLPEVAASYSGVSVVVIHSDLLAKLPPEEFDALRDWVTGGGTLAVVPTRPEDMRAGNLVGMTGGTISPTDAPPAMLTLPAYPKTGAAAGLPSYPGYYGYPTTPTPSVAPTPTYDDDPLDYHPPPPTSPSGSSAYTPIGDFHTISTTPVAPTTTGGAMTAPVKKTLSGFTGGNLAPSDYGATASYGTGEVHVLGFDPTVSPAVDDPWVQARIVDMVSRAWDHQAPRAFPTGSGDRRYIYSRGDDVRKALDPNENFRPALGFAAILLVIYSIVVGPITFLRAQKKGKILSPLKWAPLWSAATFASIVVVGLAVKGLRGRSRRVSLTEVGAGMTRGSITRFRGFYTSETRALSIQASDRSTVLDVMSGDGVMGANAIMRLDRGGTVLENITSLPWQTLVVREDGFRDLKGGVSIVPVSGTTGVNVVNHTGQSLKDALVWIPADGIHYFPEIKDGETVLGSSGKIILSSSARHASSAGAMTVHQLDEESIAYSSTLTKKDGERIKNLWNPISSASGDQVDWWPDDQPVVMGELDGGEGTKTDSGLRIESDRSLVRVVGKGGAP